MNESAQWVQWPPPGGGAVPSAPPLSPPSAPEPSLEGVTTGLAESLKSWAVPPSQDSSLTLDNIWRHPKAHPLCLTLLLLDRYGDEYLEWMPETLKTTMERDGYALSNSAWTKILAARVLLMSPSPWRQWEVFHWVCLGLAGKSPNFVYLEEPEMGHLMAGVDAMRCIDPKRQFDDEIDKFVAATFKSDGQVWIPAPCDFAQRELENPQLACDGCGALHRDDGDTKCISCGSASLRKLPFEFAGLKALVAEIFGTRKSMPPRAAIDGVPETSAGYAAARLLVHWDYTREVRSSLLQQLNLLRHVR